MSLSDYFNMWNQIRLKADKVTEPAAVSLQTCCSKSFAVSMLAC